MPEEQGPGLLETLHTLRDRLRTIEERKGMTAPSVYEKVKRETLARFQEVEAQIRASVAQRVQRLNEELEELRFRNSLGEFSPGEFQRAEQEKLTHLASTQRELGQVDEAWRSLGEVTEEDVPLARAPAPAQKPQRGEPAREGESTRPSTAPVLPRRPVEAPPPPPPRPAPPPEVDEMEALFGDMGRGAPLPRSAPPRTVEPFPGTPAPKPSSPPPPPPAPAPARPSLVHTEETTQDLGVQPVTGSRRRQVAFRPILIVKTRDRERGEDSYELATGTTLIGRAPENDIILLEESVSRRHGRVVVQNEECTYEDLGSANGSYLNGERMAPKQPRKLQDNDVIKLGQLLALYRSTPDD